MGDVLRLNVSGMEELQDLLSRMEGRGAKATIDGIHNWADYTFEVSQQLCPVDKGYLVSTGVVVHTQSGSVIAYTATYARAVHDGYVRHWVEPRRRKVLAWEPGRKARLVAGKPTGKMAFSKGHYVPRTKPRSKPNPWLEISTNRTLPLLKDFIIDEFDAQVMIEGGAA